jgi:hypothetical protein
VRIITTIFFILFFVTNSFSQANAGSDQNIWMPTTSVALSGSGGSTYQWTYLGTRAHTQEVKITSSTSASTTVTNIPVGAHQFRLTVNGGTSSDTMTVFAYPQRSPSCNAAASVTYTLSQTSAGEIYIPNAAARGWKGGDTVKIPAGTWNLVQFGTSGNPSLGFSGDSCRRIIIKIMPGCKFRYTGSSPMLRIYSGRYFTILGNWDTDTTFSGSAGISIAITDCSDNYTVKNVSVYQTDNGALSKVNIDTTNCLSYYPNWYFKNAVYEYMRIKKNAGEGLYLGHTFTPFVSGYRPVSYDGLTVQYVRVDSSGWDGIQSSCALNTLYQYDTVFYSGSANVSSQMYGLLLGGFGWGTIQNCYVYGSKSSGVAVFGYNQNKILNTYIDSCAKGSSDGVFASIYISDNLVSGLPNPTPALNIQIENNCIRNVSSYSAGAAIRFANNNLTATPGYIRYNTIYDPLSRALSNLIYDGGVGDDVSGNVLSATCPTNTTTRKGIWF